MTGKNITATVWAPTCPRYSSLSMMDQVIQCARVVYAGVPTSGMVSYCMYETMQAVLPDPGSLTEDSAHLLVLVIDDSTDEVFEMMEQIRHFIDAGNCIVFVPTTWSMYRRLATELLTINTRNLRDRKPGRINLVQRGALLDEQEHPKVHKMVNEWLHCIGVPAL